MTNDKSKSEFAQLAPYWLRRFGVQSWLFIGLILAVVVIFAGLSTISGVLIPTLIAVVVSIIFYPMVVWLDRKKTLS
jgi:predicted PurR-regulated permease PerM